MTGAAPAAYAELQVTSNYSFLRGASHPDELFAAASLLGLPALGVVDRDSVAGIVRCWDAAKETGVRLVAGCRVDLACGTALLLYPADVAAWSRLCRLLTLGKGRTEKGGFDLRWDDLLAHADGLLAVLVPDRPDAALRAGLARLRDGFGDRAYLALTLRRRPGDAARLHGLVELARAARVAPVATGDVLYHSPDRRLLQDVVTCIREGCTIDAAGFRRERHADRHLRAPAEMVRLFARYLPRRPDVVSRTLEVVNHCRFDLGELRYQYPEEVEVPGETAQQALERLTWAGATVRYPDGVPDDVSSQLRNELRLIGELEYAPYFLTVHSIVRYARSKEILCQGRGSAANSAVCYVLGITSIDPTRSGLLFERFVSAERHEPPDIDVDFEGERREEVIQWVYEHYGRDRAALCCTVMRFRARGAVRDVGKVMGLPADVTGMLASQVWPLGSAEPGSEGGVEEGHAADLNLNLGDRRLRLTLDLARQLIGFPRQLGTHPGGFVLTRDRLADLVPIEPAAMDDRQVIVWDKDDIDALRFMKVDVLGLGMLGCMRRCFELLARHKGLPVTMATVPAEDAATYAMIRRADTLGTFQIESRAQMAMLPRHKPRTFYDLVIQVAVVRPGPIQGDMVHPYLRRREKREEVSYPTPELERVLGKTLGVPLFQEQAMQVAIVCAGFTPGEADSLRRAMATFKLTGGVSHFRDKLISGMVLNGYEQDFAERTFKQIEGFGSYGFPESHAASFALIAYASSWLKCHHPDAFCCALLNSQPMGFYAPAQVVRDARDHGVEVRPVCVNQSAWDCTLEPLHPPVPGRFAVRLGLRMVAGLNALHGEQLVARRGTRPYVGAVELHRRAAVPAQALERLAAADAFSALGLSRRDALWAARGLSDAVLPLFAAAAGSGKVPRHDADGEPAVELPPMPEGREVVEDYGSTGLSLRRHPVSFLRDELRRRRMVTCAELASMRSGRRVTVAGMVLVRQKPGSAKGVMFITLEDEAGVANLVVWPSLFERQRRLILSASMVACRGRVQSESGVTHLVADCLLDLSNLLRSVGVRGKVCGEARPSFPNRTGRGDEARHGGGPDQRTVPLPRRVRDIHLPDLRLGAGIPTLAPADPGIRVPTRDFR